MLTTDLSLSIIIETTYDNNFVLNCYLIMTVIAVINYKTYSDIFVNYSSKDFSKYYC